MWNCFNKSETSSCLLIFSHIIYLAPVFAAPWWTSWCKTWCLLWSRPLSRVSSGSCGKRWCWLRCSTAGRSVGAGAGNAAAAPPSFRWSTGGGGSRPPSRAWTRRRGTGTNPRPPSPPLWPTAATLTTRRRPADGARWWEAPWGPGSRPGRSRTPSRTTTRDGRWGGGGRSSAWSPMSRWGCSPSWRLPTRTGSGDIGRPECIRCRDRRRGLAAGWEQTHRRKVWGWWGRSAGRGKNTETVLMRTCQKGNSITCFNNGCFFNFNFVLFLFICHKYERVLSTFPIHSTRADQF